jgi:hypothetical protein
MGRSISLADGSLRPSVQGGRRRVYKTDLDRCGGRIRRFVARPHLRFHISTEPCNRDSTPGSGIEIRRVVHLIRGSCPQTYCRYSVQVNSFSGGATPIYGFAFLKHWVLARKPATDSAGRAARRSTSVSEFALRHRIGADSSFDPD